MHDDVHTEQNLHALRVGSLRGEIAAAGGSSSVPHLLRNSAGLMWSSAAWASNGRSSRHLMGGAALQIAVPMSAAFVGAPIRALLSSGVRLHSLLCVQTLST